MENTVIIGGKYRHYKGNDYVVIATGILENSMEEAVIYKSLNNPERYWIRSLTNFLEITNDTQRFKFVEMYTDNVTL